MPLRRCQLCAAVVVLLSCPAASPAPVARVAGSSLQWFGWWAWGSKHLPGQTVPTAAHANIAIDENLDYLLNQPLPALLALHPPRRSDNASIFVIAPSAANPANRVGHMLLAPDWLQKLDTVVKQVHAHQPKIIGVQIGDELVDGGLSLANLSAVASRLRHTLPPSVFVYTNDGFRFKNPCRSTDECIGSGVGPAICRAGLCYPATWPYLPADLDYISCDACALPFAPSALIHDHQPYHNDACQTRVVGESTRSRRSSMSATSCRYSTRTRSSLSCLDST